MKKERIALGVITRHLNDLHPYEDFLINAEKYGHKIDTLIIEYNVSADPNIIRKLSQYCKIFTFKTEEIGHIHDKLNELNLSREDIHKLTKTPHQKKYKMFSYGKARDFVLLTAILMEQDYLLFFDSDVYPEILDKKNNQFIYKEIDFVGTHLKYLNSENTIVTTSDYTGYFIIPKMNFKHLYDLLFGLQKESVYEYVIQNDTPVIQEKVEAKIKETNKILGGNMGINLQKLSYLPPFFSLTLVLNNECFLGRGEDTLFGPLIKQSHGRCLDIDVPIFHNCFSNFPEKPNIFEKKILERFYYACMGWIIRNPFYNWLHSEYLKDASKIDYDKRYQSIKIGSKAAARYFQDSRFYRLEKAFKKAYAKLPDDITEFKNLLNSWNNFKNQYTKR